MFARSEVHMEPSVSSIRFGALPGYNLGPSLFGSISGGGINTVFAISWFASVVGWPSHPFYPSRESHTALFTSPVYCRFFLMSVLQLAPETFYKHSPCRA